MELSAGGLPKIGVLLEQTLGHVSHGRNLHRTLAETERALVACRELPFEPSGILDLVPPRSNWTLRSSLAARAAVRSIERKGPMDGLFVHTHVPAALLASTMERVPTVVSLDATPKQIDSLGGSYKHRVHADYVEAVKWRVHANCFGRAAGLVTWSKWAADGLVADYGVDRDLIEVIPPGVVPSQWRSSGSRGASDGTVRILFVGGDFQRKGGDLLIEAVERLRADPEVVGKGVPIELHLVTSANIISRPGVVVHKGLTPNDPELIDLFHRCDIFALPTLGDCTPLVLAEAAMAGLPSVATAVGAIGESVIDGVTGHLVEPNVESLAAGLRPLVVDPDHRAAVGSSAARHASLTMDAEKNARRLLDTVIERSRPRSASRVVLTVSGNVAPETDEAIAAGMRPLADYVAISDATQASLLDWSRMNEEGSFATRTIRRLAGNSIALGHHLYRKRHDFDVIVTDGEQVGLPLAALLQFGRRGSARHIMIGHRLSPGKKSIPVRLFRLAAGIDEILLYSTAQLETAEDLFDGPSPLTRLIDFMVDTEFFRPTRELGIANNRSRPLICAAGREFRDYPTLIEAVRGLDVDVVIASASPWSRREDNAGDVGLPPNVTVTAVTQAGLRELLDEASALVMPLKPSDFQAGITTILEAMSMERPVICTATEGQTDVIEDGVTGLYVAPGDQLAMRQAIKEIVSNPIEAAAMGKRGRELVEKRADVRLYADVFREVVGSHLGHGVIGDTRPQSDLKDHESVNELASY